VTQILINGIDTHALRLPAKGVPDADGQHPTVVLVHGFGAGSMASFFIPLAEAMGYAGDQHSGAHRSLFWHAQDRGVVAGAHDRSAAPFRCARPGRGAVVLPEPRAGVHHRGVTRVDRPPRRAGPPRGIIHRHATEFGRLSLGLARRRAARSAGQLGNGEQRHLRPVSRPVRADAGDDPRPAGGHRGSGRDARCRCRTRAGPAHGPAATAAPSR
jgi:hypothetical protein